MAEQERAPMELDGDDFRNPFSDICTNCKNLIDGFARSCNAFPRRNGIPDEIWEGKNRHIAPYPGDKGIRYDPIVVRSG